MSYAPYATTERHKLVASEAELRRVGDSDAGESGVWEGAQLGCFRAGPCIEQPFFKFILVQMCI